MPTYSGAVNAPTVGLWGDSTMGLAAEEIPERLNNRYRTGMEFGSGRSLTQLQNMADEFTHPTPGYIVISAGTNDVFEADQPWNGFYEFCLIKQTVDKYNGRPVIWMGLYEGDSSRYWSEAKRERAIGFNNALEYWAFHMPNLKVIDWNSAVNFLGVDNILLFDHLHATNQGQKLFAYLIDYELEKF